VVISLSTTIEFPRFLEMRLNKDNSQVTKYLLYIFGK
jgi:hypothetical protein